MNQEVHRINFKDEDTLSDLLSSTNVAEQKLRSDYIKRIKKGEKLVAVIANFASCELVLQANINGQPGDKSETEKLIAVALS